MSRPLLLDLFCGAGGAAMGYHRAGFDVVGVDILPQKRYPFPFHQGDALEFIRNHGHRFDAIHASPPCQNDSRTRHMPWTRAAKGEIPRLIGPTQDALRAIGKPYVIENVPGAALCDPITLCGLMFGLRVFRHRLFESSEYLMQMPHPSHAGERVGQKGMVCVSGHGDCNSDRRDRVTGAVVPRNRVSYDHRSVAAWRHGMDIDWMTRDELAESIPPAYTEFIGRQLMEAIR